MNRWQPTGTELFLLALLITTAVIAAITVVEPPTWVLVKGGR